MQNTSNHRYPFVKAVAIAFCLFQSVTKASPTALQGDPLSLLGHLSRSQEAKYTINLTGAHNFEKSYKVYQSISDDLFYTAPANSSGAPAGTLLKVETETNSSLYTLPPSLSLSRFMYQSKTSSGALVPVSGFILWPYAARPYHGGTPMVAWAHGTSGAAPECAPSNIQNLWYQFQGLYEIALHGYAVIATDYAGLGVARDASGKAVVHEYVTGPAQANDLFYSVPAAQQAFPTLSKDFVTMGHSEGGGAAWAFAEKLAKEPMTGHLGTVALSPFTKLLDLPPGEPILPAILLFSIPNLQNTYAPFAPEDVLTPKGVQAYQDLTQLHGCTTVVYQLVGPDILKSEWQNNPSIQKYQRVAANGGKDIRGPFLVIQGAADPIIHAPTVEAAINNTAQRHPNAQIEFHLLPNVTHTPVMYAGLPVYLGWINARFAGEAAKPGYHSSVVNPARRPSSLQTEANWFIQKQLEPYQMT